MVAAALLFQSLRNAGILDLGFDPDPVVVASFDLQKSGYERSRIVAFYDELLSRARKMPGIEMASVAQFVPMEGRGHSAAVIIPGMTVPSESDASRVPYNRVSSHYFGTVRQKLVRGRDFTAHDTAPPVAIVNEAFARRFWPGEDPLEKRIKLADDSASREIIGVVRDARFASFGGEVGPFLFVPALPLSEPMLTLHVRTSNASAAVANIRRLADEIDGNVVYEIRTMREAMAFALVPVRVAQTVFGVAGLIALILASGGLYGLVCYTLERRTREIGIRIALGAGRGHVLGLVVGGAIRLVSAGLAIGAGIAMAAGRLLSSLLYGLGPSDPTTFGGVAALLVVVTLGAGYTAARTGLAVDPAVALRHE
jgi:predicted permease